MLEESKCFGKIQIFCGTKGKCISFFFAERNLFGIDIWLGGWGELSMADSIFQKSSESKGFRQKMSHTPGVLKLYNRTLFFFFKVGFMFVLKLVKDILQLFSKPVFVWLIFGVLFCFVSRCPDLRIHEGN